MPRPPPPPHAETKQGATRPRSRPHPSPSPDRVRARPALPQGPAAPILAALFSAALFVAGILSGESPFDVVAKCLVEPLGAGRPDMKDVGEIDGVVRVWPARRWRAED